jgi:iron complex outermembrane receptor protein
VFDFAPINALYADSGRETERNEFTQELRIRSNDDARPAVAPGLYGSYSDYNMSKAFQEYSPLFTTAVTNSPFRMFSTEFAPFGQLEIPLTDALNLTTGLRWHTVNRSASVNYEWAFTAPISTPAWRTTGPSCCRA